MLLNPLVAREFEIEVLFFTATLKKEKDLQNKLIDN